MQNTQNTQENNQEVNTSSKADGTKVWLHEDAISSNGLTKEQIDAFPSELKLKIRHAKMMIGRLNNNNTPAQEEAAEFASSQAAHAILDYIEKDLPDEPSQQEENNLQEVDAVVFTPRIYERENNNEVLETQAVVFTPRIYERENNNEVLETQQEIPQNENNSQITEQTQTMQKRDAGIFGMFGW